MDVSVNPDISFPTENPNNTITLQNGSWNPDSKIYIATYTVTDANEEIADIDVTVENAVDKAGNIQAASTSNDLFSIDNQNPNAPSIISFTEDTDVVGDGITKDNTLIISGSAEANSSIEIFQDSNSIGTTTTDNSGSWNFDYTNTTLEDNTYTFSAIVKDAAGNASDTSTLLVTVDAVNDAPTLENDIENLTAIQDTAFNFTLSADTFADSNVGDILTYSATLDDNSQLPTWLSFTNSSFTGTPTSDNLGEINIKVTATDKSGASVSDTFTLEVEKPNNPPHRLLMMQFSLSQKIAKKIL